MQAIGKTSLHFASHRQGCWIPSSVIMMNSVQVQMVRMFASEKGGNKKGGNVKEKIMGEMATSKAFFESLYNFNEAIEETSR